MDHADAANSLGSQTLCECVCVVGRSTHLHTLCVEGLKTTIYFHCSRFLLVLHSIFAFPPHPAFPFQEKWWDIYNFCGESEAFKHFLDGNLGGETSRDFLVFFCCCSWTPLRFRLQEGTPREGIYDDGSELLFFFVFCFDTTLPASLPGGARVKWVVVTGEFWNKRKLVFFLQFFKCLSVRHCSMKEWSRLLYCFWKVKSLISLLF